MVYDTDKMLDGVTRIHTLGPAGTNCEQAAREWFRRRDVPGEAHLHRTLEDAARAVPRDGSAVLLACVVYPDLHNLVFQNLGSMTLVDTFIVPTHRMVLASRDGRPVRTVVTHPAPQSLVPPTATKIMTTSNTQAALDCVGGRADGCITTLPAATAHGLRVLVDFGPVPMGFTLHAVTSEHATAREAA